MCLNHFPAAPPCAFLGLGWGPRPLPHPESWWVWWGEGRELPGPLLCGQSMGSGSLPRTPSPPVPKPGGLCWNPHLQRGWGATRTDPTARGKEVTALPASRPGGTQVGAQAQPAGGGLGVTPAQQAGWGPRQVWSQVWQPLPGRGSCSEAGPVPPATQVSS